MLDIPPLANWLPLLCVPPMFAGLAITHWVVGIKKLGTAWLVFTYMTLLMMPPAIILLGLSDSMLDLRKRLERPKQ